MPQSKHYEIYSVCKRVLTVTRVPLTPQDLYNLLPGSEGDIIENFYRAANDIRERSDIKTPS